MYAYRLSENTEGEVKSKAHIVPEKEMMKIVKIHAKAFFMNKLKMQNYPLPPKKKKLIKNGIQILFLGSKCKLFESVCIHSIKDSHIYLFSFLSSRVCCQSKP